MIDCSFQRGAQWLIHNVLTLPRRRVGPADLPAWLDKEFYVRRIQPQLREVTLSALASKLGISIPYAVDIRSARRIPHPRHWQTLAQLVGVSLG